MNSSISSEFRTINLQLTNFNSAPTSFDLLVSLLPIIHKTICVHTRKLKEKGADLMLQGRDTTYPEEPEKHQILASGLKFNYM